MIKAYLSVCSQGLEHPKYPQVVLKPMPFEYGGPTVTSETVHGSRTEKFGSCSRDCVVHELEVFTVWCSTNFAEPCPMGCDF